MPADIPHFSFPFKFVQDRGKTVASVNEQGSPEEVFDSVHLITRVPRGSRIDLLDFGVTDQVFRENGYDLEQLASEINEWEPRAEIDALNQKSEYQMLFERIRANVGIREET